MSTCVILALVFIALKLSGQIDWSWLWVLSPIWLPWAFFLALFVLLSAVWLAAETINRVLGY